MSVSGTPGTTYDDGFPKAHPSLPPSTRRSGRGVVHRRTLVELTDDHERLATRVVDPTLSTAERAGGGVGPWETRRRTSGQAYRWARQSDRTSGQAYRQPRPVDRRRLGRHSFELRHYAELERDPEAAGDLVDVLRFGAVDIERAPGDEIRGGEIEDHVRGEAVGATRHPLVAEIALLAAPGGVPGRDDPARQDPVEVGALRVHRRVRPAEVRDAPQRESRRQGVVGRERREDAAVLVVARRRTQDEAVPRSEEAGRVVDAAGPDLRPGVHVGEAGADRLVGTNDAAAGVLNVVVGAHAGGVHDPRLEAERTRADADDGVGDERSDVDLVHLAGTGTARLAAARAHLLPP